MASPSMTVGTTGNVLASSTITASAASANLDVDYSVKFEAQVSISVTFGTVAATSGLQVDCYRRIGSGPTVETIAFPSFVIPSTASTTKTKSVTLPTGRWRIILTNTDATNSVTAVTVTADTVDGIT